MSGLNLRPLVRAIRRHIKLPRLDRVHQEAPMRWSRPPLAADFTLKTEDGTDLLLADFVKLRSSISLDGLRGVYEEYVHGFIVEQRFSERPVIWMRDRLELARDEGTWLFPPTLIRSRYPDLHQRMLTILLWHMGNQDKNCVLTCNSDGVVLELPGRWRIGIENGEVLSRYKSGIQIMPADFASFLTDPHIGQPSTSRNANINAIYRATNVVPPEDREAVRVALRILFWREPHTQRLIRLFYAHKPGAAEVHEAVQAAKEYLKTKPEAPLPFLYRKLVPVALDARAFQEAFGNPYHTYARAPTDLKRAIWMGVLDQIINRPINENKKRGNRHEESHEQSAGA